MTHDLTTPRARAGTPTRALLAGGRSPARCSSPSRRPAVHVTATGPPTAPAWHGVPWQVVLLSTQDAMAAETRQRPILKPVCPPPAGRTQPQQAPSDMPPHRSLADTRLSEGAVRCAVTGSSSIRGTTAGAATSLMRS
jgi:hypothetical protein